MTLARPSRLSRMDEFEPLIGTWTTEATHPMLAGVVVPGHGPVADGQALADYVAMLTTIRDRMTALIASGATLKQVEASRPTSEWDEKKGDPKSFLDRAYLSISRDRPPSGGPSAAVRR